MVFPRVTAFAQELVSRVLEPGGHAIDATVGNGRDTRFLASCVGHGGRVDGFDIQEEALETARRNLADAPQVHLHLLGHERIGEVVRGPVAAVMFNLGYLPSGDKRLVTRPETTVAALDAAFGLLCDGGVLTAVVYPGHEGGLAEAEAVAAWFARLERPRHRIVHYGPPFPPWKTESPRLLALARGGRGG
jgi:hypothetical protein